jgi:hypothetical protein
MLAVVSFLSIKRQSAPARHRRQKAAAARSGGVGR